MNLLLVSICCLFAAVSGLKKNGTCESVKNAEPMTPFNLTAYAGIWYEISKYEDGGNCATVTYTSVEDPVQIINITNTITFLSTRINVSAEGTAEQPDKNVGKLIGHFKPGGVKTDLEYRILKTDYKNFAVLYSCKNDSTNTSYEESAWVLSRDRVLSAASKRAVQAVIQASPINDSLLKPTEQDEYICTYLTACDKTIAPVQENFDAAAYLGEWYEISRYDKLFETDGDCVTANYSSAETGGLVVHNTMKNLKDKKTSSILGTAVLAYDKGEPLLGLLLVSFNVSGVDTKAEYRVLSTDYKSYSVVYSCQNVNGRISYGAAWVLSRTRKLTNPEEVKKIVDASHIKGEEMRITEQDEKKCNGATASQIASSFLILTALVTSFIVNE